MSCQTDEHVFNSEVIDANGDEVASILTEENARAIASIPELLGQIERWKKRYQEACIENDKLRSMVGRIKIKSEGKDDESLQHENG